MVVLASKAKPIVPFSCGLFPLTHILHHLVLRGADHAQTLRWRCPSLLLSASGLSQETEDLIATIRSSPPHRNPRASHGNMPVWYPSQKMQCVIKAESHRVEFAFLLEAEYGDDVLEYFDQPSPPLQLAYLDKQGRRQTPFHTADYFVLTYHAAGWQECKPVEELIRLKDMQPHRYVLDEQGQWRCPPGEAAASRLGLTYQVRASDQINWVIQENWLALEDYHQDPQPPRSARRSALRACCSRRDVSWDQPFRTASGGSAHSSRLDQHCHCQASALRRSALFPSD